MINDIVFIDSSTMPELGAIKHGNQISPRRSWHRASALAGFRPHQLSTCLKLVQLFGLQ